MFKKPDATLTERRGPLLLRRVNSILIKQLALDVHT